MIVRLTENDRLEVLNYLYQESAYNIFPIGDIESFGFDKDFQRVYGEKDELGNYLSVFLRYRENAIYYSHLKHFNIEYLEIFKKDSFDFISGKTELMSLINPYLTNYNLSQMYFCQAKTIKVPLVKNDLDIKIVNKKADCKKLFKLLSSIVEFHAYHQNEKDFIESKMKSLKMGTTLFLEKDGEVISSVATTAETTKSAMVIAVATRKDHRNKGLASKLMLELMKMYIIDKKKDLCLFYDNPDAGKIYLKLGFEYLGLWSMYKLKE